MGDLKIRNLSFKLGLTPFNFSADFAQNRWHILCGPSGSGKTTLLRMLTGLAQPQGGAIHLGNLEIGSLPPHERSLSLMTQANALFPGLNAMNNLMLALHDSPDTVDVRQQKVLEVTKALDLDTSMLQRSINELSGGQISRFNLARALLRPCSWLLLDEPFAAVDRPTRLAILSHLQMFQKSRNLGIILVSHDLDDILSVADDITVITGGAIVESAPIKEAIDRPRHKTTARTLRSGAIISKSGQDFFLAAKNVHLSPEEVRCDRDTLDSYSFNNARSMRLGAVMRVLDLDTDSDFTLPTSQGFHGKIWFDRNDLQPLQVSPVIR